MAATESTTTLVFRKESVHAEGFGAHWPAQVATGQVSEVDRHKWPLARSQKLTSVAGPGSRRPRTGSRTGLVNPSSPPSTRRPTEPIPPTATSASSTARRTNADCDQAPGSTCVCVLGEAEEQIGPTVLARKLLAGDALRRDQRKISASSGARKERRKGGGAAIR